MTTEADDRYLDEIAADCRSAVGPGGTVLELTRVRRVPTSVELIARVQVGDTVWESAATGDTIVEAHARLRDRILIDRVRFGFTSLVEAR